MRASFQDLIAEGDSVPVDGWDFSWFEGRASEERPSFGYSGLVTRRVGGVESVLDVQTGGGEVFAEVLRHADRLPSRLVATESFPPNVALATDRLSRFCVEVVEVGDHEILPPYPEAFELVVSRHPVATDFAAIAMVLSPGGTYLSQQVGAGSNAELTEALMGPQAQSTRRDPLVVAAEAERVGLEVTRLEDERLEVCFFDVAAVVHFLHKVPWTVPGFSSTRCHDELARVHETIEREGRFVSHSRRFLIEARKASS